MKILGIETSCDETAAAVTEGVKVLSSVKITQAIHAQWGGVVPSLAKRDHEQNIDWVIDQALKQAGVSLVEVDAIAVTMGPGLAIALGVGISKAKEMAKKENKPLVAVNHIEGHILSSLVNEIEDLTNKEAMALIISGGHTQLIKMEKIGKYKIVAESLDDDIGEALDKGARLLGLPYPGGAALEQLAAKGRLGKYQLPLPMAGKEDNRFSYAGLKAAFARLVEKLPPNLNEQERADLAAAYQNRVFQHVVRITRKILESEPTGGRLLVGGGVAANKTLKAKLEEMGAELGWEIKYPENLTLCTDNAAMIAVAGGFKAQRGEFVKAEELDRRPRWRVDEI